MDYSDFKEIIIPQKKMKKVLPKRILDEIDSEIYDRMVDDEEEILDKQALRTNCYNCEGELCDAKYLVTLAFAGDCGVHIVTLPFDQSGNVDYTRRGDEYFTENYLRKLLDKFEDWEVA